MNNSFSKFTNQYSLSKTLRFELKPVGKTLDNMRQQLKYDKDLQTFLKDQAIKDSYQKLKPLFDSIHEEFITDSLESQIAKKLDFSGYLVSYRKEGDLRENEKTLRGGIGTTFVETGTNWKEEKYPQYEWKKGSKVANGSSILLSQDVLRLIKDSSLDNEELKKMVDETFKGFFTYLGGFNQNRENYYTINEEKATAVATRIVHENLPKFCDNLLQFEAIIKKKADRGIERIERKHEYLGAYDYLKQQDKITQIKDAETGEIIKVEPIKERIFDITHFPFCLSQNEIEEYNRTIGHYNLLINLYNQAKESEEQDLHKSQKTFKRLPIFKTLYKQIGCGRKSSLFFAITHDKTVEAEQVRNEDKEAFSVEEVLHLAKQAGDKYFQNSDNEVIRAVPDLLDYIYNRETYEGIYWSKAALNNISNKYFANYHTLKDRLKENKVFQKASKGSEDDVKIPEAIELQGLFKVLDETNNWKEEGVFFKKSLTEKRKREDDNVKNQKRKSIIAKMKKPSVALLNLIFADVQENMEMFLKLSDSVLELTEYKSEKSKETIKTWMDYALTVNQILKYFWVKENKAKGSPIDPTLSEGLNTLIRADDAEWFKWYDALRNYLTKKPQDDAKKNKLKLNFENGSLLGGWSDGQEKSKAAVLLKRNKQYYLGVLKKKNIFDTKNGKNLIYRNLKNDAKRLLLANLSFKTLAGKGFLGEFGQKYGDMGQEDPERAIKCLKKIIRDRYVRKYPLLEKVLKTEYSDKKIFDADITEVLKECYTCEFTPINWELVEKYTNNGDMYLFTIYSKDFSQQSGGKKNLQTLYWNAIFESDSPIQLNGGGEIFYRQKAIKEKKIKRGYEMKPWIIENKRFTENKQLTERQIPSTTDGKLFFFHCPIKINYKSKSYSAPKYAVSEINRVINGNISSTPNLHFLGIDRGEKHLTYYSLIDRDGKIVDQGTLNLPFTSKDGSPRSTKREKYTYDKKNDKWVSNEVECWNYNDLLEAMVSNRDMARKNWRTIGTIKELKEGYLSQIVRRVADLATSDDRPAFIVLEDLNTGFKRRRQKIEKSVYQKFEVALAKKLNFLVDKTKEIDEIGSVTKALQLTPPVNNYGDIENRKQVGIMLYTRANYTSQTDPVTGWRKTIYLKVGSEENIKKQIVNTFTDMEFDGNDYVFTYTDERTRKEWKLYSGVNGESLDRFRGKRGEDKYEWINERQDFVRMLDRIFVDFDKGRSLLSQIIDEDIPLRKISEKHTAWESLRFVIDLIQQIRNTGITHRDNDFILSPVRDENNKHFDSREYWDKEQAGQKVNMPTSGDANGAFNIARKGFLMNEHIRAWKENGEPKYDKNSNDLNLFISDFEWDLYLTNEKEWKYKLTTFASRKLSEQSNK